MTTNNVSPAPGAAAALAGYEYQLDVSVLAALRLMLVNNSANKITLEPANDEDLEVDLAPAVPGRVVPSAIVSGGYKLVIQVKLSSGEPWSIEEFRSLLLHGVDRTPAYKHLNHPDTHYLLVTSAGTKGVALDLLVSDFEEAADPKKFPPTLKKTLRKKPAGRVAIWGNLSVRQLELEIKHILGVVLRVPHTRQKACRDALREEAKARMRGTLAGDWKKEDLIATLHAHGGYLASAEELEFFVEPGNFEDMKARLAALNAIVITGSSGTGKTWAATALCDQICKDDRATDLITVSPNDGPAAARKLMQGGPSLFYIEDPWGQYTLNPGAEPWTEQLPRLLRQAGPSSRYVITSRQDMLAEARAADELKQWMIALNAEHYNGGELAQIYDRRMGLLPPEKQGAALAFRERALERLETPLELQLFFSGLLDAPESGAESSEFMAELLASAHRGAVAGVVVKYLAAIEDVRVAAFVWGLLVRGGFTREQLARVQRLMRGSDPAFADLLGKSVDRLIATRHLRQPALKVSYAHPSVREGFEQFLRQNWWKGTDAIEQLCRLLVGMDEADRAWGLETGARILQATGLLARAARQALEFDKRIHAEVDGWLEQSLIDPRAKFAALMHLAAGAGSTRSVPAELARWLLAQTQTFTADDPAVEMPEEPDYDDAWFERVRQHPQAATIAARFIREQLMQESLFVATGFLANLDRIADGLTPAFLDVAEQAAESRALPYLEVVGAGAVRDIVGYERVVDKALDMCARANTLTPEEAVELAAIRDGEDDTPNASAFEEQYAYETHTARGLIAEYVYARRCRGDRQGIASHPRAAELIEFWAWDIASAAQPTSEAEIGALLDAAMGTGDEAAAWDAARRHWSPKLGPRLAQRLRDCKEDGTLRQALATCACANAPELMKLCLQDAAADPAAFVSLLVALHAMSREPELERTDIPPGLLDPWPEAGDIVAAFASADTAPQRVAGTALALLEACSDSVAPSVLAKLVPVLIASDSRPAEAIRRWLAQANTVSDAAAAAKAVVDIADDGLAELALVHARADARSAGLAYLAGRAPVPLPERLLRCADDKSGRVRLALARALAGRPHPDHVRVLARLAHDQWSDGDYMFEEPTRYAVARAAVQTLSAYGVLPAATGNALVSIGFATADRKLGRKALLVAAAQGGPAVQTAIWKRVKDEKLQDGRVAGLVALTKAPAVDAGIVGAFDSAKLLEWPPTLAVTATAFIARHAPVHDAVRIIEDAAHAASHRALLLVGAWQLALRQPTAANGLLGLLPAGHPARQLLDSSIILPENALDQLGEVRIRKSVKQWFKAATSRAFGVPVAPAQEN